MPSSTVITPAELDALRVSATVQLIDVRPPGEFASVHIPGAFNIPLDTLREHHGELRSALTPPVVLVCASGSRATQAARLLPDGEVRVLAGGMGAWLAADGEVVRGGPRWTLERQVRLTAGMVVAVAVAASFVWEPARLIAGVVGAGLVMAAVTNTCAMAHLLNWLPYNRAPLPCTVGEVAAALRETTVARGSTTTPT